MISLRDLLLAVIAICAVVAVLIIAGCVPRSVDAATCSEQLDCQLNEARIAVGLPPLAASVSLTVAAQQHAPYLAERAARAAQGELPLEDVLTHVSANGSNQQDRAYAAGHGDWLVSEVLAGPSPSVESAIAALLGSPRHREIILGGSYTLVGIGVAQQGSETYYSVSLGRTP